MLKLIVVLCLIGAPLLAQTVIGLNAVPPGEKELTTVTMNKWAQGEQQCGKYFVLIPQYGSNSGQGLMFKYADSNEKIGFMGLMNISKFQISIDPTKRVPTLEMVSRGPAINRETRVVVRISEADYKMASCLPKPKSQ